MGSLNVVETCLVENCNNKWIIDSGVINHVCYSLQWIKQSNLLSKGQRSLKLGNKEYVFAMAIGDNRPKKGIFAHLTFDI